MKLQRQHFLLSYLKTLSVGPVGVTNSRPPALQPGTQPNEPPVRGGSLPGSLPGTQNLDITMLIFNFSGPPIEVPRFCLALNQRT